MNLIVVKPCSYHSRFIHPSRFHPFMAANMNGYFSSIHGLFPPIFPAKMVPDTIFLFHGIMIYNNNKHQNITINLSVKCIYYFYFHFVEPYDYYGCDYCCFLHLVVVVVVDDDDDDESSSSFVE